LAAALGVFSLPGGSGSCGGSGCLLPGGFLSSGLRGIITTSSTDGLLPLALLVELVSAIAVLRIGVVTASAIAILVRSTSGSSTASSLASRHAQSHVGTAEHTSLTFISIHASLTGANSLRLDALGLRRFGLGTSDGGLSVAEFSLGPAVSFVQSSSTFASGAVGAASAIYEPPRTSSNPRTAISKSEPARPDGGLLSGGFLSSSLLSGGSLSFFLLLGGFRGGFAGLISCFTVVAVVLADVRDVLTHSRAILCIFVFCSAESSPLDKICAVGVSVSLYSGSSVNTASVLFVVRSGVAILGSEVDVGSGIESSFRRIVLGKGEALALGVSLVTSCGSDVHDLMEHGHTELHGGVASGKGEGANTDVSRTAFDCAPVGADIS